MPQTPHAGFSARGLAQRARTAARMMAERSAFGILAHLASPPFLPISCAVMGRFMS